MARVHKQENSRKVHTCRKGHEIPAGETYWWAKPGFRRRTPLIACAAHPFRQSELTTSAASEPMAAVEAFEDEAAAGFSTIEDLTTAWDSLREAVESYRDQRQEALDAWEYGNSQLEEYLETAEAALQEVEGFTPEEWSGDEEPEDTDSDAWAEWEDEHSQHVQDQTDEALSVVGSLEF